MRKLRRLPWRIPKSHNQQPSTPASAMDACPRAEPERRPLRDEYNTQPVAFAGGRYVYGDAPSDAPSVVCRPPEIRRKARHRVVLVGA
jgi:hypothetical protein